MKTKALTAAQIDKLAQRLSDTPIEPSASTKKAGDNLACLVAARIGSNRAALVFTSIMTGETFDQAEARLTLVLDYGNPDPAGEPIPVLVDQPIPITPVVGKRQAILDQAQSGALPQAPDFSKPTHARFRAKLAQIVALAEVGDIAALHLSSDTQFYELTRHPLLRGVAQRSGPGRALTATIQSARPGPRSARC
jgi:hypothetical protein